MSFEDLTVEHLDEINKVVEKYLQGSEPTQISKDLALPRQKVVAHINQWKLMAADNAAIRARAKEALVVADTHYNKLISKAYEVIDEATTIANLGAKTAGIKLVLDIESKRIDMLQKAGMLDNHEMAEKIIETEQRQEVIVGVIRDVVSGCDKCRIEVAERLSRISDKAEEI